VKVRILIGNWEGTVGTLLDAIPWTGWYNVRVTPTLRLALYRHEFEIV
jgi:hypothetical protein